MKRKFLKILALSSLMLTAGGVIAIGQMNSDGITRHAEAKEEIDFFNANTLTSVPGSGETIFSNSYATFKRGNKSFTSFGTSTSTSITLNNHEFTQVLLPSGSSNTASKSALDIVVAKNVKIGVYCTVGDSKWKSAAKESAVMANDGTNDITIIANKSFAANSLTYGTFDAEAGKTYKLYCSASARLIFGGFETINTVANNFNVSFYDGDLKIENLSQAVEEGATIATTGYDYTLADNGTMQFIGWSTTKDSSVAEYTAETITTCPITKETTFYAVWKDTSLTEITSFKGFTNGTYDTPINIDYDGTKNNQSIISEIKNMLPTSVTPMYGETTINAIDVTWDYELKEGESIVGTKTFVGSYTVPTGYSCTIALKANVTIRDVREVVTEVLDSLEFNVAEGVDLNKVLPTQINVKTSKSEEKLVDITWNIKQEELKVGENIIVGNLAQTYLLSDSLSTGINAKVNIKAKTISTEVSEANYVTWDARTQTKALQYYDKNLDGDYIVIDENGVKVTASSTMVDGTTAAGGNAMQIAVNGGAWIKFDVPFDATLKVRAGANGSGKRTFNFTSSDSAYNANIIGTKQTNIGAANAFDNENGVVSVNVSAGTYYFWNATGSSAQVYGISVDKLASKSTYGFVQNEKLLSANELPTQEGYTFAGWVNPNGELENGVASMAGEYAPVYYKATANYDVRLTGEPGIKYCFEIEFINGDALDLTKLAVNLKLIATNTVNVANASYEYLGGVLRSNAVVVGWNAETASAWKNIDVTASIEVMLGDKVVASHTSETKSANTIANDLLTKDPTLQEDLSMYL